ncbi:hypothetical protein TNCT_137331 [Trichonephila clavata]|uniref:Uncharacterized protein n=1 Tax=Trichonephila clavata TaxID=2740835 RepID=A0A8X6KQG7_TRICU|nr:hypothetical protein TNCT_137331 [Trichonephila clavata]
MIDMKKFFSWLLPALVLYNFWSTIIYFNLPSLLNLIAIVYLLNQLFEITQNKIIRYNKRHSSSQTPNPLAKLKTSSSQTPNLQEKLSTSSTQTTLITTINTLTQTLTIQNTNSTQTILSTTEKSTQTYIIIENTYSKIIELKNQSPAAKETPHHQIPEKETDNFGGKKIKSILESEKSKTSQVTSYDESDQYFTLPELSVQSSSLSSDSSVSKKKKSGWRKLKKTFWKIKKSSKSKTSIKRQ